jgi:hypothetical protein
VSPSVIRQRSAAAKLGFVLAGDQADLWSPPMNILASLRQSFRDLLGVKIENDQVRPDIQQLESEVAISRLFQGEAMRHQLDHDIAAGGYFRRLDDNSDHLGRAR